MAISDELGKLDDLRRSGALTEDEFARAKARLLDGTVGAPGPAPGVTAINALRRSRSDRWLGGVCGGLAAPTGVESWAWRLIFALFFLFGGLGLILYVLLWIFVPS